MADSPHILRLIVMLDPPIAGLSEDNDGYWWIACDAGVLRIRAEELEHALSDPAYRASYELFDLLDGLPARPVVQPIPVLTKTVDGRIWIATGNGIAYIDPAGFQGTQCFRRCVSKA